MSGLTFDEPSHAYALDSVRIPSVTQVLSFGKDLSRIPRYTALFGTLVHSACELDTLGELDEDSLVAQGIDGHWCDPWPRLRAWQSHRNTRALRNNEIVHAVEQKVWGEIDGLRFAGTIDVIWYEWGRPLVVTVADLKTGQPRPAEHGPQVAAYAVAYAQRKGCEVRARECIYLGDGRSERRAYDEPAHLETFRTKLKTWYDANGGDDDGTAEVGSGQLAV